MNQRFNAFLFAFVLGLVLAPRSPLHAESRVRIGMELAYPPFEMRDESGKPAGVSVDLAQAFGESLERPVEIVNLPFDGLIPALKTGKIDLILSSMTSTPERARAIDFSEPYLRTGLCLLVGKGSGIGSIADVNGKGRRVVVKRGTTGHLYAAKELRAAEVAVLDKENACVLEVVQGKAGAFIYDQMSIFSHWRRNAETTQALLAPFQEESWAMGINRGADELRAKANAFIAAYRGKGGFEKIGDKWLPEQKAEFKKLGIPFLF